MNLPLLRRRVCDLEDRAEGEPHLIIIEWEDGTPVATWEMKGDTFIRVVPENDGHNLINKINKM